MISPTKLRAVTALILGAAVMSCASQPPTAAAPPPNVGSRPPIGDVAADDAAVRKAQDNWYAALKKHDADAVASLLEDRFILTTPDGETWAKDDFVSGVRSGSLVIEAEDFEGEHVESYGDAAILTGSLTLRGSRDGNDISGSYRFVETWIKTADQWRKAASVYMQANE